MRPPRSTGGPVASQGSLACSNLHDSVVVWMRLFGLRISNSEGEAPCVDMLFLFPFLSFCAFHTFQPLEMIRLLLEMADCGCSASSGKLFGTHPRQHSHARCQCSAGGRASWLAHATDAQHLIDDLVDESTMQSWTGRIARNDTTLCAVVVITSKLSNSSSLWDPDTLWIP